MGYPMTFTRLIRRNGLANYREGYDGGSALHGDLLRWVENSQDHQHVAFFARISGATEDQVRTIFALLFDDQLSLTANGMPLGRHSSLHGILEVDGLPDGAELTLRADQKRIAELERRLEEQDQWFHEALAQLRNGEPVTHG